MFLLFNIVGPQRINIFFPVRFHRWNHTSSKLFCFFWRLLILALVIKLILIMINYQFFSIRTSKNKLIFKICLQLELYQSQKSVGNGNNFLLYLVSNGNKLFLFVIYTDIWRKLKLYKDHALDDFTEVIPTKTRTHPDKLCRWNYVKYTGLYYFEFVY